MKINPFALLGTYLRRTREVKKGGKGGADKASPYGQTSDSVQISETAQTVERLSEMVSTEPDVRVERVSEVEQKISDGKHHPTDKEMAESLVKTTIMDNLL